MLCQVFCSQRPASQKHPPNFGNTSLNIGAPDEKQKNTLSLIPAAEKDPEKGRRLNMKKKNTSSCSLTNILCSFYGKKTEASCQTHCLGIIIPLSSSPCQANLFLSQAIRKEWSQTGLLHILAQHTASVSCQAALYSKNVSVSSMGILISKR